MGDLRSSLFGSVAVRAGLCTRRQVQECLDLQKQYQGAGKRVPRMGEILASKGHLSIEQVKAILTGEVTEPGKRFGEICATLQFCTIDQVKDALEEQSRLDSLKEAHRRLGEILLKQGHLKAEQLPPVLQAQGIEIAECTKCRRSYNVRASAGQEAWKCPKCGRDLIGVIGYEDVTAVAEEAVAPPAEEELEELPAGAPAQAAPAVVPAEPPPPAPAAAGGKAAPYVVSKEPADDLIVEEVEEVVLGEEEEREYGGFVTEERLGSDAQGDLYKARHKETAQLVTLKLYDISRSKNDAFVKQFVEEAKRVTGVEHPGLKKVAGAGKDKGHLYYASEFVAGKSLRRLIGEQGRIPTRVATHIVRQVAEVLKHAHGKGMVHGEVRPSNIIVTHDGKVKLAGLGQAKDPRANILFLARSAGEVPLYMAPEQGTEGAMVDHRADVFSLGATWYHMVAGSPPYKGKAPIEVLMRMAEEDVERPETVQPKVQKPISDIIMKMMAIEPDERYQSMQALLLDVENIASLETGKFEPVKELSYPKEQARPEGGEFRRSRRKSRTGMRASRRVTKVAESPRRRGTVAMTRRERERPPRVARAARAGREKERPPRAEREERPSRGAMARRGGSSAATGWIAAVLILLVGFALVMLILYAGDYFGPGEPIEEEAGYEDVYEEETSTPTPPRPAPVIGRPPAPPPQPEEKKPEPVFGRSLLGPRAPLDTRKRKDKDAP